MKKLLVFLLVGATGLAQTVSVHRNLAASGAVLGGIAGAIIGNNSGHGNGAKGALVGAAAGAILGSAAESPAPRYQGGGNPVLGGALVGGIIGNNTGHGNGARGALIGASAGAILGSPGYARRPAVRPYYAGYGYGRPGYGYYASPGYYGSVGYYGSYGSGGSSANYVADDRSDSVGAGLLLGGIAGAIIGNNSGHGNGGRGALIGAGIGALLGAFSEPAPRVRAETRRSVAARTSYVEQMQAMSQAAPQSVTIVNNYYASAPASGGYKMDAPAY